MSLNIPAGYYEFAHTHRVSTSLRTAVCTIGMQYFGSDYATDVAVAADAWGTTIVDSMADVWAYTRFTSRDATGVITDLSMGVSGGTAHTAATPNVAFLFKKTTSLGGRKQRGRMYLPGVSEQDVDEMGIVVESKLTELASNMGSWIAAVEAAHFGPTLLHNGTTAPTSLSGIVIESLAATQRRRMRK